MSVELDYGDIKLAVIEYDALRHCIKKLIKSLESELDNQNITKRTFDSIHEGLLKMKEESEERKEFNRWEAKSRTDKNYEKAFKEIMDKCWRI